MNTSKAAREETQSRRTTPWCFCVLGWRRSRCRWDGTSSPSAPWPPPELPPRTERRVSLFRKKHRNMMMQQVETVGGGSAVGEWTDLHWRRWAQCGGGSPGNPSWPRRSECLQNWVWSWSDRTGGPPRRIRCSNRCRCERCAPKSAGGTEETSFSCCVTNCYQLLEWNVPTHLQ